MSFWRNTVAAFRREVKIIAQRPIYIVSSVVAISFCAFFFLTFFNEGLPRELPIGVVDQDESSISRRFVREMNATSLVEVRQHYANYHEAREAMQRGEVYAFFVIPENLYADILANRRPSFQFYVNTTFFVGGSLSYKQLLTMANLVSGAVQREVLRAKGVNDDAIMGRIQPIVVDTHQIGNPYTNYGIYLLNVLLPGILEMIILLVMVYAIGSELKFKTSREMLSNAGNSMLAAMMGKVLPYTILFTLLGVCCDCLLYKVMHFPVAGSFGNMVLDMLLLVVASQATAITIIGLLPVLRDGLSGAALYSVLAFSLTGFTFPVEYMPRIVQGLSTLFPLRYYYQFYVQEAVFGTGIAGWWHQALSMLCFLVPPLLVYKRLTKALIKQNFPTK